ncbi:hypothetical protein OKZ62_001742 [Vibrio navarrensis]|nr:hypothetical protein [Vibrio navarrensis]
MCRTANIDNHQPFGISPFLMEFVLDTKGEQKETVCPSCGRQAEEEHFDEFVTGSINAVYSIDCCHCGHHECSQESCCICEALAEAKNAEFEPVWKSDLLLDYLVENLELGLRIKPSDVTHLKELIHQSRSRFEWYEADFVRDGGISYVKKALLDASFKGKLDLKISQALEEMA